MVPPSSLRIFGTISAISIGLWSVYNFFEAIFWSGHEHDTSDLPLSAMLCLSILCLSFFMGYAVYKNSHLAYRNAFIVSWLILVLPIGQLIISLFTRYYGTEGTLYKFGFEGSDIQTAAFLLCLLKIALSAIPTVTFHLLWRQTIKEDPAPEKTVFLKQTNLTTAEVRHNDVSSVSATRTF